MQKLIWASLDDYLPPVDGFHHVGRNVANHNFFEALLKYGSFDEYHFFLANGAHRRLFMERHGAFLKEIGAAHRVKLFDRLELPVQVRQYDYTVFHQSDHITFFNSLCHFRNQTASFPVTAFIHSLSYQHFMSKYLEMIMGGATSFDALICSSVCGKEVLKKCFAQITSKLNLEGPLLQMEVIPLGIDGSKFDRLERPKCRKEFGLDEKEVVGLCFGRFSDYDKMDLFPLLQALQSIGQNGRPWRLVLAGAVHSENYYKMLKLWTQALGIKHKVTFITNLSEKDKRTLYGAADFFISVSDNLQETFGLTLLEAMASGLPLLVSDFDGYREIVTEDVGKRIKTTWDDFEPLAALARLMDEPTYHRYLAQSVCVDVQQLGNVLEAFFSNVDMCREMGKSARDRFLRLYDYRIVIPRLEAFWSKLKANFGHHTGQTGSDPLSMNVFDCFSHYVTEKLSADAKITRTQYAQSLLESGIKYPLLSEMNNLIDCEEMTTILKQTEEPVYMSEIISIDLEEEWKKHYLLQWMSKHGLLQIVGD